MTEMNSKKWPARRLRIAFLALSALGATVGAAAFAFVKWRGVSYPEYTVDFGNNQKTTLHMKRRGEQMTGVLNVAPSKVAQAPFNAFGFHLVHHGLERFRKFTQPIPPGDYALQGLFSKPRSYRLVGHFPQPLADFSIGGEVPDATKPGTYIFVAAGAVANGVLPALDGTLPPKTPSNFVEKGAPSLACPTCLINGTLKKSPDSNSEANSFSIGLLYGHLPVKRSGLWVGSYVRADGKNTQQIVFSIEPPPNVPLRAGQIFSLAKGSGNSLNYSEYGTHSKDWDSIAGTVKILDVSKGEITFAIKDAPLKARIGGDARGTLKVDAKGKMRGTGLIQKGMLYSRRLQENS